jgi:hypothetical protein
VTKWAKQQLALFLSNETAEATKAAKSKRKTKAVEAAKQASKNKTPAAEETVGDLIEA